MFLLSGPSRLLEKVRPTMSKCRPFSFHCCPRPWRPLSPTVPGGSAACPTAGPDPSCSLENQDQWPNLQEWSQTRKPSQHAGVGQTAGAVRAGRARRPVQRRGGGEPLGRAAWTREAWPLWLWLPCPDHLVAGIALNVPVALHHFLCGRLVVLHLPVRGSELRACGLLSEVTQ